MISLLNFQSTIDKPPVSYIIIKSVVDKSRVCMFLSYCLGGTTLNNHILLLPFFVHVKLGIQKSLFSSTISSKINVHLKALPVNFFVPQNR